MNGGDGKKSRRVAEALPDTPLETPGAADSWYKTIADFTYDWVYWEGSDGRMKYVSPSSERVTGYTPEQFVRNPGLLEELIVPQDRPLWLEHSHSGQRSEPAEIQFRIQAKDGSVRWIEHACQPVRDRNGVFQGHRVSNRDITQRKEVEEELRRHRERLEELVGERTKELARSNEALREEIDVREQVEQALRLAKETAESARRDEQARRQEARKAR